MKKIKRIILIIIIIFFLIPQNIQGQNKGYFGIFIQYSGNNGCGGRTHYKVDGTPGFGIYYEYFLLPSLSFKISTSYRYYFYNIYDDYWYNAGTDDIDYKKNLFILGLSGNIYLKLIGPFRFFISPGCGFFLGTIKMDGTKTELYHPKNLIKIYDSRWSINKLYLAAEAGLSILVHDHFELFWSVKYDGILQYVLVGYESFGSLNLGLNIKF